MTRIKKLDALFNQWIKERPLYKNNFHKDGIINEVLYEKAKKKVLFIMKEPNSPDKSTWPFQDLWKDGVKYLFSYRLADWGYGIMNDFPPYETLSSNPGLRDEAIWSIALINLKKSGGGASSRNSEIYEHYKKNREFILQEIELIDPDFIVLGTGSWSIREELFNKKDFIELEHEIFIGKWKNTIIIDFFHASARKENKWLYKELAKVFKTKQYLSMVAK